MSANARHRAAETRFLSLVEDAALPRPDRIEYGPETVTFYWEQSRAAVIVDLEDDMPSVATDGARR
jgi:hypothetical protein